MTTTTTRFDKYVRSLFVLASLLAILAAINYKTEQWADKQLEALTKLNTEPPESLDTKSTYFVNGIEVDYDHNQ
ncbi:MAG: hypothetical protein IH845_00735 [Nanoarchaeota archaeon]|nr:hypothetical protein [Nanoarchaeota archaeon]